MGAAPAAAHERQARARSLEARAPDGRGQVLRSPGPADGPAGKSSGYLQGASRGCAVGENLAWGRGAASTPASLVRAWLNSPGHRKNIMDRRWRQTGVSTTLATPQGVSGGTVVQVFGRRY